MAEIVLAIGTSHSPLLASPPEDYPRHAEIDAKGRKLLDKNGKPCSYGELLAQADPSIKKQIDPEILRERAARCTANIERLAQIIRDAKLDTLIIIGDDQNEQFFDDKMPSILIYWGDAIGTIRSTCPRTRRSSGARHARNITRLGPHAIIRSTPASDCTSSHR